MGTFEHTEPTTATPEAIWARYRDPATWPEWDQPGSRVDLDFRAGAQGTFTSPAGKTSRLHIADIGPTGFTEVTRLGIWKLTVAHSVTPLRVRVVLSGMLSGLLGSLIGARIAGSQRAALSRLARLAEAGG